MKKLILFLLLVVFANANDTIDNGKAFFYSLDKVKNPLVKMGNKTLSVFPHPSQKDKIFTIIPINYKTKDKEKQIQVFSDNKIIDTLTLEITKGKYKKEVLKVSKKHVSPPKKTLKRIQDEYLKAMKIYNTFTDKNFIKTPFDLPMDSKITSAFGNARLFNDQLKSYHSGTDFRAKVGTPVKAINDGVVVLVKDRYYAGGSVIVDHGMGIYSCYFHLSSYKVKVGQKVKKGDILALSGASGRITGPHLHLSIKVNGITVAPLDFMNKYNSLFKN